MVSVEKDGQVFGTWEEIDLPMVVAIYLLFHDTKYHCLYLS